MTAAADTPRNRDLLWALYEACTRRGYTLTVRHDSLRMAGPSRHTWRAVQLDGGDFEAAVTALLEHLGEQPRQEPTP